MSVKVAAFELLTPEEVKALVRLRSDDYELWQLLLAFAETAFSEEPSCEPLPGVEGVASRLFRPGTRVTWCTGCFSTVLFDGATMYDWPPERHRCRL